jgi:cytosine/creatinine deaminase
VLLRSATLADGSVADVRVCLDRIAEVATTLTPQDGEDVVELAGHVLIASPVEPHAHLDKAFLADRVPNPKGDLLTAIDGMHTYAPHMTVDDIAERAERAIRLLAANGVTTIRTHADCYEGHGLRSIEGLHLARKRAADVCDVQIAVLIGRPVTGVAGANHRALLHDALEAGVDVVGSCPHLDDDPLDAMHLTLSLAAERGLPIDLHTDETLDPHHLNLRDFALAIRDTGFAHPAAASHCVSLGMQPPDVQREVAELCAQAGVVVIALPQTNLFLQGRDVSCAVPRGLTALRALLDAGAPLAAGADNLQDPFNTMGRGDPMETASLLVMAGHLSPLEALAAVTTGARTALGLEAVDVAAGSVADLAAYPAATVREAMAFGRAPALVLRAGTRVP